MAAIAHKAPDRVPKGELAIESGIRDALLAGENMEGASQLAREVRVRQLLGIDLVDIHEYPQRLVGYAADGHPILEGALGERVKANGISTQLVKPALADIDDDYPPLDIGLCTTHQLDYYKKNTDFFLFCQIGGPVSMLDWMLGMEDYLCWCLTDTERVAEVARIVTHFEVERAKIFLDHGADAILLADDIAYNTGPFLPPGVMDQVAWPIYREMIRAIKAHKDVPVFLHTDGYIWDLLDGIVESGFDGLQSIQPSAGMEIDKVKAKYGDALCLMGNMDLDYLMTFGTPEEVEKEVERVVSVAGQNGGFILSTCNILTNSVKPENALAMYRAAEKVGEP